MGGIGRPENASEDDRPFAEARRTIHDALRIVGQHRWIFFIPFCVVSCAAFVLSLYYPRTYRASTEFEYEYDPITMNIPMAEGALAFRNFRIALGHELTSGHDLRSLETMRVVVDRLGLTKDLDRNADGALTSMSKRRRDAIARSFSSLLKVTTTPISQFNDIIKITYTGGDPTIGKSLVEETKRTYIERTQEWMNDYLVSQLVYWQNEVDEAQVVLKRTREAETGLFLAHPHIDPRDPAALARRLADREADRRALLLRKKEYQADLSAVEQMLSSLEPGLPSPAEQHQPSDDGSVALPKWLNPRVMVLKSSILEIEQQADELKRRRGVTNHHPDMVELLERRATAVAQLETLLAAEPVTAPDEAIGQPAELPRTSNLLVHNNAWQTENRSLLYQIQAHTAKIKEVNVSLRTTQEMIDTLNKAKQRYYKTQEEFAHVLAEAKQARDALEEYKRTLWSIAPTIKLNEQDKLLHFDAKQPARGSSRPISPKASSIVLLALLAGLGTGVVFVLLAEVFDHVYRSSGQVARGLGLPMLESIDEIITPQDRRVRFLKRAVLMPIVVTLFLGVTAFAGSMAYLSIERPRTFERLRKIPEAAIQLFTGDMKPVDPLAASSS